MDSPDLLVYPGSGLKSLGTDAAGVLHVEGYLVRFSDEHTPDLAGDYFTKATDFGPLSDGLPVTLPAYYDHGMDSTLKRERIGVVSVKMDDEGVFAEYTITRRQNYLERLAAEGHLGQSSGAVPHVVEREDGPTGKAWHIKAWPLGEGSLTPTPCEPNTTATVKAIRFSEPSGTKAESVSAWLDRVYRAGYAAFADRGYIAEVFEDAVIADMGGVTYRVPFAADDTTVTFAPAPEWERVERTVSYDPAKSLAASLKAITDRLEAGAIATALKAIA